MTGTTLKNDELTFELTDGRTLVQLHDAGWNLSADAIGEIVECLHGRNSHYWIVHEGRSENLRAADVKRILHGTKVLYEGGAIV